MGTFMLEITEGGEWGLGCTVGEMTHVKTSSAPEWDAQVPCLSCSHMCPPEPLYQCQMDNCFCSIWLHFISPSPCFLCFPLCWKYCFLMNIRN